MNPRSFATLVTAHAGKLMLYARQWTTMPEDIVQEAFLRLVKLREPPEDVPAWLFRVVRNAAIDDARQKRSRRVREVKAARKESWFVESAVEGLDAQEAVEALERLPLEQREVIVARLWGGLNFEQISAVSECSASTAFRRYTAGIESLRQMLGVACQDPSSIS